MPTKTMNTLFSIFFITSFFVTCNGKEFYCKYEEENYKVCRTCTDLDYDCEVPEACQCGNIQIYNRDSGILEGGSDCSSVDEETGENWCYVSEGACLDAEDPEDYVDEQIWHSNNIKKSRAACTEDYKVEFNLGNEEVMMGIELMDDVLKGFSLNGTDGEALSVYVEDYEECQEECKTRCGFCGGWSFDDIEGICYLHNIDACCGQINKQEANPNFISGYVCPKCSSTFNDCPCDRKKRREQCNTAQSSGAEETDYNTSAGLLRVDKINTNADPCACENRTFKRRGRTTCRCTKPQCHNQSFNPGGTCKDKRRCRERKLNPKRFKPC